MNFLNIFRGEEKSKPEEKPKQKQQPPPARPQQQIQNRPEPAVTPKQNQPPKPLPNMFQGMTKPTKISNAEIKQLQPAIIIAQPVAVQKQSNPAPAQVGPNFGKFVEVKKPPVTFQVDQVESNNNANSIPSRSFQESSSGFGSQTPQTKPMGGPMFGKFMTQASPPVVNQESAENNLPPKSLSFSKFSTQTTTSENVSDQVSTNFQNNTIHTEPEEKQSFEKEDDLLDSVSNSGSTVNTRTPIIIERFQDRLNLNPGLNHSSSKDYEDTNSWSNNKNETGNNVVLPRNETPKNVDFPENQPSRQPMLIENFDHRKMFEKIELNNRKIKNDLKEIILSQHELSRKMSCLNEENKTLHERLGQVEKDQNYAVELENYDQAEQLEIVLKQIKEMINVNQNEIVQCEKKLDIYEKSKESIYKEEILHNRQSLQKLELLEEAKKRECVKYKETEEKKLSSERRELEEELERITININHNDLNLKHIEEERLGMEENINKQTKEYKTEYDILLKTKNDLEVAIKKIELELKTKQKELEATSNSLVNTEKIIQNIRGKFDDHLKKIQKKNQSALVEKTEFDKEKEKVNTKLKKLTNAEQEFNDNINKYQEILSQMDSTKTELHSRHNILIKIGDNRDSLYRNYEKSKYLFDSLQTKLKNTQSETDDCLKKIQTIENELGEISHKKISLEQKIPILEKEKKTAAAERNFSEAGKIANEIKDVRETLKNIELAQSDLEIEKNKIAFTLTQIKTDAVENQVRLKNCKEQLEIDKYFLLKQQQGDLNEILRFSQENSQLSSPEKDSILAEINQIQLEIDVLYAEYKLKIGEKNIDNNEAQQHESIQKDLHEVNLLDDKLTQQQEAFIPTYGESNYTTNSLLDENYVTEHHTDLNEKCIEIVQPIVQETLEELLAGHDRLLAEFNENEENIKHLADNDDFEAADNLQQKNNLIQASVQEKKQKILDLGHNSIEDARNSL